MNGTLSIGGLRRRLAQQARRVVRAPYRGARFASRLFRPSPFPVSTRLCWAGSGDHGEGFWGQARMLGFCLRTDADGEPYYLLGGKRYYFRPHFEVDEQELREGIELILRERYLKQEPEPPQVRPRRGETVLDLGGNIGTLAMLFAEQVGGRGKVWSFEPIMHRPLERNLSVNGLGNVHVVPLAVADASGPLDFSIHGNCIDSRVVGTAAVERRVTVQAVTIDEWVERHRIGRVDVIKSDIEGAEEAAMAGARQTVRRFRPRWIISSYHTDPQGRRQHPRLVALLRGWGYRVEEIEQRRVFAW